MNYVPRDASEEQVLGIVRGWVEALARKEYKGVFEAIDLMIRGDAPGPECIQGCIEYYRSPVYYPGVDKFAVSDWRIAQGGNPEPVQRVEWYGPNTLQMAGAVSFDLPLNGRWSDLTADFVFFENDDPEGYRLWLEEIGSWQQRERDYQEQDQRELAALGLEPLEAHSGEASPSASAQVSRFDIAGEPLAQKSNASSA